MTEAKLIISGGICGLYGVIAFAITYVLVDRALNYINKKVFHLN